MKYFKDYFKDGFKFSGRTNRKDFWITMLYVVLSWVILFLLSWIIDILPDTINSLFKILWIIISLSWAVVTFICNLAIITRRLHDVNRSGGWLAASILLLTPLWIVVLVFCCMDSVNENNEY